MLLFCDVDSSTGKIISFVAGKYIIPTRQYDYFFYLNEDIIDDLQHYRLIDGSLVRLSQ